MSTNEELMAARDTMSLPSYNVKFKQLLPIHKAINVQPGDLRCSIACLETPRTSANVASLDANADTSDNVATCRSRSILFFSYWALIVSLIVALVASLIVIAFVVDHDAKRNVRNPRKGVPNSSLKATDRIDDAGRKEYYESLLLFLGETIMAPDSAQSNSLEWMAFDDIPIDAITSNRFWQRFALVVWYFEQGGTTLWSAVNSDPSAGWISFGEGVHECDWKGVDCDVHFQVTGLRLGIGMGITMTGTFLSTELGVLTHLNQLDLSGHRLQGSIPGQWQSLTNLETLIVSNNELRSAIPDWIGNFTKLKTLALDKNQFTALPVSLSSITSLRVLLLNDNLGLVDIQLEDFVTSLTRLEYLDISMTHIGGTIPVTNESILYFGDALEIFQARRARLTGTIPTEISRWSNLKNLALEGLPIRGTIPTELGLLTNLEVLQIAYADLMEGTLPTELGRLTNLSSLDFSWSKREGTLPVEYDDLTRLAELYLSHNHGITGEIPSEYGHMTSLRQLYLEATSLEGVVGPEICALNLNSFETDCSRNKEIECTCCTQCQNNL